MSAETKEKISESLIERYINNPKEIKSYNVKKCKYCKKLFMPDKSSRSYCSFDCYNKSRNGVNKNEISYRTFHKILKRAFTNWSCPFCEWKGCFEVHHIYGRKDNNLNSLVMLCPNHHSLAHKGEIPTEDMEKHSIGSKCSKEDLLKFYEGKLEVFNVNFYRYKMKKEANKKMIAERKTITLDPENIMAGDGI